MSRVKPYEELTRGQQRRRNARASRIRLAAAELKNPRICSACHEPKEREDFSSFMVRGKRHWHTLCIHCRNTRYLKSSTCASKRALIDRLRNKPCHDCGAVHDPRIMRFDCVCNYPRFNLTAAWTGRSEASIIEEANNYQVVCPTCKAIRALRSRGDIRESKSKLAELPPDLQARAGLALTS